MRQFPAPQGFACRSLALAADQRWHAECLKSLQLLFALEPNA
jgi:hypothetical protein